MTTYGVIGVKAWIFKGEVFDKVKPEAEATEAADKTTAEKPTVEATA